MGRKDFQKGMEAGAKPFEDKLKQQADAINRVSDKIETGIKKIDGVVENVIDELSSIQKKELFDLNTQFDINNLEEFEKEQLLSCLFTLANDSANENQQAYIRSVKKYLDIKTPQTQIDLSGIENIENLMTQKAMFQTICEFLFLKNENFDFFNEYSVFFDYFSIKKKDSDIILENVMKIYKATGAQGLCEKYGYAIDKKSIKAPAVVDSLNMTLIDNPLEIAANEEKTFSEQKIRLLAPITCAGKLVFERCVIIYNSGKLDDNVITVNGGTITISNCTIIDKNELKTKYKNNSFLTGKKRDGILKNVITGVFNLLNTYENKPIEKKVETIEKSYLFCDNTLFHNCENFAYGFITKINDCVFRFTDLLTSTNDVLIATQESESSIENCLFENINISRTEEEKHDNDKGSQSNLTQLFEYFSIVTNCTFKNLCSCVNSFKKVQYCHFTNCVGILHQGGEIINCVFESSFNCLNTVNKILNCQFVKC